MNEFQTLLHQIDRIGGVNGYKASTNPSYPWNRLIERYNRSTGKRQKLGCAACRQNIYNWLKNNAK